MEELNDDNSCKHFGGLMIQIAQVAECLVYLSGFQPGALEPKSPCFI